jgi:hypothetical protein
MAGLVVESTKRILYENLPKLREQYWEESARPPKWMDRLQAAAGPHKSGNDPHIAGRALDIILFASQPLELEMANDLVEVFLGLREKMKWIAVIYNSEEWNRAGLKFPRTGSPENRHVTHIHVEWDAANINLVGFEADLAAALKKGLAKFRLTGQSFYIYVGADSNPQKIRDLRASYVERIKGQGGDVTDVLSVWLDYIVKIGSEVKLPGDPLPTPLEDGRALGIKIIETDELERILAV